MARKPAIRLPGTEVVDGRAYAIAMIKLRVSQLEVPPALLGAASVGKEVFESKIFSDQSYFVFYEHPVLKGRDKLHLVSRNELLPFLKTEIDRDHMWGLDIVVTPQDDMGFCLVCNHDGEMFLLAGPEAGIERAAGSSDNGT